MIVIKMIALNLFIAVLCLQISFTYSAPLQLQQLQHLLLQPYQRLMMQPQEQNMQQRLMELQAVQQLNQISGPTALNNQFPPLLLFLPDHQTNMNVEEKLNTDNNIDTELKLRDYTKSNNGDSDSVVINAEPIPIIEEQKAFLMLPNGRLSIGNLISAIPFLPIEINVPDTISWAYNGIANGIAGIISIIGQRLPFQRPSMDTATKSINLKTLINNLQMKNDKENMMGPINMMMPFNGFNGPLLPVQL